RAGDLLAGRRRLVGRADRGRGGGDRRRLRGRHQVPRRGAADRRAALLDRRRPAAGRAGGRVPPQPVFGRPGRRPGGAGAAMSAAPDAVPADGQAGPEEPTVERLLEFFEQMAVIRATEKAAYDLFMSGLVKGTTHLASGQEAVAAGASAALRPADYVFATY